MSRMRFSGPVRAMTQMIILASVLGVFAFSVIIGSIVLYLRDTSFSLFIPFTVLAIYYPMTSWANKKIKSFRYMLIVENEKLEKIFQNRTHQTIFLDKECHIVDYKKEIHIYQGDEMMRLHRSVDRFDELNDYIRKKILYEGDIH